jgi:ribosomal protein L20A (L18A)
MKLTKVDIENRWDTVWWQTWDFLWHDSHKEVNNETWVNIMDGIYNKIHGNHQIKRFVKQQIEDMI